MSTGWSIFVIAGTVLSLVFYLLFLLANRSRPSSLETTGHDYDGIQEYNNPLPAWWVWGFVISIFFAVGYLIYYPGLGNYDGIGDWSSAGQVKEELQAKHEKFAPLYDRLAAMNADELAADTQAQRIGRRLFVNNCAACHGINAQGAFGFPNLTDDEWQWGAGFDAIKTTITNGRHAAMAAWIGPLGGEQGVRDMANYVRSLSGAEHDAAAAARAEPKFKTFCSVCHGANGKGNPLFGAPDLTNDTWLYGGSLDQIIFTLTNGRAGVMPAQQNILSPEEIHIVAGYVHALRNR